MRVAAYDCGSNSTRILVCDEQGITLRREMRITRLGQGVDVTGRLAGEAIQRCTTALQEFRIMADELGVERSALVATSAVRDAVNGSVFLSQAADITGAEVATLSGLEEAELTFRGATAGLTMNIPTVVIDIGGGSLEIAVGVDESPEVATSLPLGASRLTQKFLSGNPYSQKGITAMRDHIESQLEAVLPAIVKHQDSDRSIATSKTLRTLARLSGDWFDTNGNNIKFDVIRKIATRLADMTHEERTKLPGVSSNRAKQIVAGAFVTESVMRNLDLRELEICPWALREGIVLKYMDWMEKG